MDDDDCNHIINCEGTCMECGLCDIMPTNWTDVKIDRTMNTMTYFRKLKHFKSIIDKFKGVEYVKIKEEDRVLIENYLRKYNEPISETHIKSVLKHLKLGKYVQSSYMLFRLFSNDTHLKQNITMYEAYLEYMFQQIFKEFVKIYKHIYFIKSNFLIFMPLQECQYYSLTDTYMFKNLNTFQKQMKMYLVCRKNVKTTYKNFK